MKNIMTTSNKLLLGLLLTILVFVTVMLSVARMNMVESKFHFEQKNMPPMPPAPPIPPTPAE